MRVALCFSGHLRTFRATWKNIKKNIIDVLQPDIFLHTWNQVGITTSSKREGIYHYKTYSKKEFEENELQKALDMYQPIKYEIEDQKDIKFNITDIIKKRSMIGDFDRFYFQMYSYYRANQLKKEYENKNNFIYDMVIRARPDIKYPEGIPFEKMDTSKNIVYSSDHRNGTFPRLRDPFAVGNSFSIDQYCESYNKVNEYLYDGAIFTAESLINRSLYYSKIDTYAIPEFQMIRVMAREGKKNKDILFPPSLESSMHIIRSSKLRRIVNGMLKIKEDKISKNPKAMKIPDRDIFFIVSDKKEEIQDNVLGAFNKHYPLMEFIVDSEIKHYRPFIRREVF